MDSYQIYLLVGLSNLLKFKVLVQNLCLEFNKENFQEEKTSHLFEFQ